MPEFDLRYNIAPTTNIVVIRDGEEGRTGAMMRWRLIPWWFKGLGKSRCYIMRAPKPFMRRSFSR